VLFVSNRMPETGCGISLWGHLQVDALRAAGCEVTYHESWPPVYLPDDAGAYDVVYLNYHPITLAHIQPQHLPIWRPKGAIKPLICAYIHEAHPHWWERNQFPDIWRALDLRLTEEPIPGQDVIPFQLPAPNYVPKGDWPRSGSAPLIGHTGIRGDGLDRLGPACERNGWELSTSKTAGRWLTMEEEIERLAACDILVAHLHGGYSGQSSSVMTAIAARRPLLINSNRMLQQIWARDQELAKELYRIEDVETGIATILVDLALGVAKRPLQLAEHYSWRNQTAKLIEIWKERLS
jgi:hypothetical protein